MTDKKEPLDLVGRAAARLNLDGWGGPDRAAQQPTQAPIARDIPSQAMVSPSMPAAALSPHLMDSPTANPPSSAPPGQQIDIDFVALQRDGFLTPDTVDGRLAEEFRLIKRPLLRIAFDSRATGKGEGHVMMVTSSHPDDGKTFVSTNLALSIASEQDLFVLAMDTDIRRRGLSRRLGVADRPGIMDVLLNPTMTLADVIVRTSIPNLTIIPAGREAGGSTELFASQRMRKLVADITSRYKDRIIILDTPPVLAASEAGVLASHVGQIAFVVNSGETNKRSIHESLRLISVCPNVHFVLNRMSQATADDRFGYYSY